MTTASADVCLLSLEEVAARIASKEISPVELTQTLLGSHRASQSNPQCVHDRHQSIRRSPRRRLQNARSLAVATVDQLHGVPVAHKDLFDTKGVRTTAGSKIFAERVPAADATVVRRMTEAGAITLGKLGMHEWAFGGHIRQSALRCHTQSLGHRPLACRVFGWLWFGDRRGTRLRDDWERHGWKHPHAAHRSAGALGSCRRMAAPVSPEPSHSRGRSTTRARSHGRCGTRRSSCRRSPATIRLTARPRIAQFLTISMASRRGRRDYASVCQSSTSERSAMQTSGRAFEGALRALEGAGATVREIDAPQIERYYTAAASIIVVDAAAYHAPWFPSRTNDYGADVAALLGIGQTIPGHVFAAAMHTLAVARGGEADVMLDRRRRHRRSDDSVHRADHPGNSGPRSVRPAPHFHDAVRSHRAAGAGVAVRAHGNRPSGKHLLRRPPVGRGGCAARGTGVGTGPRAVSNSRPLICGRGSPYFRPVP